MSSKNFTPVAPSFDFVKTDHEVLALWEKHQIFKKSEHTARLGKYFVFYDGPPGTNGRPHIGHIMQSSLKDVWPRFKTMQGYTVLRKAGWDTHGLPVELTSEAELGIKSKSDIEKLGVKKFIEHCRKTVLRFRDDWVKAITRLGRFVDFENDYLTMSNDFIQSDWWVLKKAFDSNLLYKDYKIVPYCCRCGTGLSSHEVAQGYQDITDLTLTAKFRLVGEEQTSILAWTTTPWTLLGNVALTIGADIEYCKVAVKDPHGKEELVILAKDTLEANSKGLGKDYKVVSTFKGLTLVGKHYQPLWEFSKVNAPGKIHEVVADDYVTTSDGTGVVHLALYGEDDFRIIKKFGFVQNQHVGADGICGEQCGPYRGRFFREEGLDVDIVKDLAARGLLFDKYRYEHSYPFCWRCKTPLLYFARSSWFIRTTAYKDVMIAANNEIVWQPPHIRDGRFGNWLENNVDWAISRDRYWGSPLNIWSSEKDPTRKVSPASIKELQSLGAYFESTGKPIPSDFDLHIPTIDDVVFKGTDGTLYRRETGVLDCWFNAGVMPWGQFGYPAKPGSEEVFNKQYPADFICEAIDQTRGWFYTLLAVSCLVTGKSSFKNVICTEHVVDASGKKMSKSLGNIIDPVPLIDKFGADAVRWTFYVGDPWQIKRYSEELPKEALRAVFIPLWNCYSFLVTYALLDKWTPTQSKEQSQVELDRWILSALRTTIKTVTIGLERYDIAMASESISDFIDSLSNWYIRRSRKRFWKSENDTDKRCAYATLHEVLVTFSKLISPLAPFIAEVMYQNLVRPFSDDAPESVHLCTWPDPNQFKEEPALEEEIATIKEAASLARALRTEHDLKVRQPLSRLLLTPSRPELRSALERHTASLADEVNVKEVVIVDDSAAYVDVKIKPNWKALGPRFGKKMQALGGAIQKLSADKVSALSQGRSITLELDGEQAELSPADVAVEHSAKPGHVARSGKRSTVALTTELTPELLVEGNARELLSVIQRYRKTLNFEINDHIRVKVWGPADIENAVTAHKSYLARECLAKDFSYEGQGNAASVNGEAFEINGLKTQLQLIKV